MIVIVRGDWYVIINNNTTRKNRRQSAERGRERKRGGFAALALDSAQGPAGCKYLATRVRL